MGLFFLLKLIHQARSKGSRLCRHGSQWTRSEFPSQSEEKEESDIEDGEIAPDLTNNNAVLVRTNSNL